jgi:hypothetical protein
MRIGVLRRYPPASGASIVRRPGRSRAGLDGERSSGSAVRLAGGRGLIADAPFGAQRHDVRRMATTNRRREYHAMDALSMVILAIGSLACLELAAHHLRGEERRRHTARSSRARR